MNENRISTLTSVVFIPMVLMAASIFLTSLAQAQGLTHEKGAVVPPSVSIDRSTNYQKAQATETKFGHAGSSDGDNSCILSDNPDNCDASQFGIYVPDAPSSVNPPYSWDMTPTISWSTSEGAISYVLSAHLDPDCTSEPFRDLYYSDLTGNSFELPLKDVPESSLIVYFCMFAIHPGGVEIPAQNNALVQYAASHDNADQCTASGTQILHAIMITFTDRPEPTRTIESIVQDLALVELFYEENSYGKLNIPSQVHGYYHLDLLSSDNLDNIKRAALQAAAVDGASFHDCDHVLLIGHFGYSAPYGGLALGRYKYTYMTPTPKYLRVATVQADWGLRPMAHEFGHGLRLGHASVVNFLDYGNEYSMMGSGYGYFTAGEKYFLGWFEPDEHLLVQSSGQFLLRPLHSRLEGLKTISLCDSPFCTSGPPTASPRWFFVEYRQPVGFDEGFGYNQYEGVLIQTYKILSAYSSGLTGPHGSDNFALDATPESPNTYSRDSALMLGRSFTDPDGRFTVTPVELTPAGATIQVNFHSDYPNNSAPVIESHSINTTILENGWVEATFEVVASDPDGDELSIFWDFRRGFIDPFYVPGTFDSGAQVTHLFSPTESIGAKVSVSDRKGQETEFVQVGNPPTCEDNIPPLPQITGPTSGIAGESINYSASSSVDFDGTIVGYRWRINQGGEDVAEYTTEDISHVFETAGEYILQLQAWDDCDGTWFAQVNVTIS